MRFAFAERSGFIQNLHWRPRIAQDDPVHSAFAEELPRRHLDLDHFNEIALFEAQFGFTFHVDASRKTGNTRSEFDLTP